jgi:hypothetical protein
MFFLVHKKKSLLLRNISCTHEVDAIVDEGVVVVAAAVVVLPLLPLLLPTVVGDGGMVDRT